MPLTRTDCRFDHLNTVKLWRRLHERAPFQLEVKLMDENRQMTIFDSLLGGDDLFEEEGGTFPDEGNDAGTAGTGADGINEGFITGTAAEEADDDGYAPGDTGNGDGVTPEKPGKKRPEMTDGERKADAAERKKKEAAGAKERKAKAKADAETRLETAREKAAAEEAERERLGQLPHGELLRLAQEFVVAQAGEIREKDPAASGIVSLVLPYINGRIGSDDAFCAAMLSGGKTFSGMYRYIHDYFYRKAKEANDALPEKERKRAGSYASPDDTELYAPAGEYLERLEAGEAVREAEENLRKETAKKEPAKKETPAKPAGKAGKAGDQAGKPGKASEADLFADMESLFDF